MLKLLGTSAIALLLSGCYVMHDHGHRGGYGYGGHGHHGGHRGHR
ncbi:hypothetical protein [Comamonas resistens]|uniref:Lipoprotein n=1 Tax=Comamonas resistens TaxID=3046670 RepID=A0ABY8SQ90_9BURK|nr:hypothetical protein [Comamonas resistens]MDL5038500.1 hypothetical protein [Comamonas resistens]WHS64651.1 hypothetical protein QMY55_19480 [Comamonas resistens]